MSNDYWGNNPKQFIGVVEDTNDPWNSNYVRVRIAGVHTEIGKNEGSGPGSDGGTNSSGGGSGGTGSGGSGGGSTGAAPGGGSTGSGGGTGGTSTPAVGKISVDRSNLPTAANLDGKISQLYTLRQLTVGAAGFHSKTSSQRGIQQGLLTADIIYNLANLATNNLDAMKTQFTRLTINSGWRLGYSAADRSASGGNHPKGYAADVSCPGVSPRELANWAQTNLKGRFNFLMIYRTFIHIQLGSSTGRQGSTSSPLVRNG